MTSDPSWVGRYSVGEQCLHTVGKSEQSDVWPSAISCPLWANYDAH